MLHDFLALLPLLIVIVIALAAKKMAEALLAGTLVSMVLLHRWDFLGGTVDAFYEVLSNGSFQFVILTVIGLGALIQLLQHSGALMGFKTVILRFAHSPRSSLLAAWLLSLILFVDEYLNSLASTFVLRDITDSHGVPREHLAFQAHGMACSLCIIVPFTGWTAFTISLVREYGMGFDEYVHSIRFMLFPLLVILFCLLLAVGALPKVGALKDAYARVERGGPALLEEPGGLGSLIDLEALDTEKTAPAFYAIVPLAALVIGFFLLDRDLVQAQILALAVQFVLYTAGGLMTAGEFFQGFFDGAKSMTTITIVIGLGFMLSKANEELGFFELFVRVMGGSLPAQAMPVVAFILVGLCVFCMGSCWVVMLITVPMFMELAMVSGVSAELMMGAVMSGVGMGFSLCFYADTVFMTTAGTGVSNLQIIKTTLPYAAVMIVLSAAGYIALGAATV